MVVLLAFALVCLSLGLRPEVPLPHVGSVEPASEKEVEDVLGVVELVELIKRAEGRGACENLGDWEELAIFDRAHALKGGNPCDQDRLTSGRKWPLKGEINRD